MAAAATAHSAMKVEFLMDERSAGGASRAR